MQNIFCHCSSIFFKQGCPPALFYITTARDINLNEFITRTLNCLWPLAQFDETKCSFKIKLPFIAGTGTAQPFPFTSVSNNNLCTIRAINLVSKLMQRDISSS